MQPFVRRALASIAFLAIAGCASELPPPARPPALVVLDSVDVDWSAFGSPHLTEMLVDGDARVVYLANSDDALVVARGPADGALQIAFQSRPPGSAPDLRLPKCTTLALHRESATLYCGAPDRSGLARFDVGAPDAPELVEMGVSLGTADGPRDLHVAGDTLYAALFDGGLRAAAIAADGSLAAFEVVLAGTVVGVAGEGDTLVVLDRARGAVVLRRDGAEHVELGALALEGPLLDLEVHDGRFAIARGSAGALVARLGPTGPEDVVPIEPPCVATSIDFRDDAVAVGCTSAVLLYDTTSAPRLAGHVPAALTATDLRFVGDVLRTVEWWSLRRLDVDPAASVAFPITREGHYVRPGDDLEILLQNPGDMPLSVHLRSTRSGGPSLPSARIAPGGSETISLARATLGALPDAFGYRLFDVTTDEAGSTASQTVSIVVRDASPPPAPGDAFPILDDPEGTVPFAGEWTLVSFVFPTCALQWPELEDLGWLARTGALPHGARAVVVHAANYDLPAEERARVMQRWAAGDVEHRALEGSIRGIGTSSLDALDHTFVVRSIPGADFGSQYLVDPDGFVRAYARVWRGRWAL